MDEPKLVAKETSSAPADNKSKPDPKTETTPPSKKNLLISLPRDPSYKPKIFPWVNDSPDMPNLASMYNRLNDPNELLPYDSQKHIYDTLPCSFKVLNREIERKVKAIELNQRIIIKR